MKKFLLALTICIAMTSCKNNKTDVDLIIYNANIYTVDNQFNKATAFAVKKGKFIDVGSNKSILKKYNPRMSFDAQRKSVYPGFIDGHCHFLSYGENKVRYADLRGCKSFEEVLERLEKHEESNTSEWLLGRGWDQNLWENKEFPDNKMLQERFPDKRVLIKRIDGHAVLVTPNILKDLGFDERTVVEGGDIIKRKDNSLTGILLDNAADMASSIIPPLDNIQIAKALRTAQHDCVSLGLTTVTDAGLTIEAIETIDSMQQSGALQMRVNAMVNPDDETMDYFIQRGIIEKDRLTVRSVKIYADGALGSRGAKLIEPYTDAPETDGITVGSDSFYNHVCEKAYNAGYQVCCHAIGDSGVRMILNIYSKYLKGTNDLRWRVEHSQTVHPDDMHLYRDFSIIPSIQATHCTSDWSWASERLGNERIKTAYAYKTLLEQNGWIINGTDFPIEHISPIYTFYASVARKDLSGMPSDGFQMENALSREEALKSITIWAAKGSFNENRTGSIEIGKDADFIILSDDIMTIEEEKIPSVKVTNTFINGELIY